MPNNIIVANNFKFNNFDLKKTFKALKNGYVNFNEILISNNANILRNINYFQILFNYLISIFVNNEHFIEYLYFCLEPCMNLFTYMDKIESPFVKHDFFYDLCYSFLYRKEFLININLINFLGFKKKLYMLRFLKRNKILFEEIEYKNHENKIWIVVSYFNFKKLIMFLNTKNSQSIKKYFIKLESLIYLYCDYQKKYDDDLNKFKHEIKIQELEDKINELRRR